MLVSSLGYHDTKIDVSLYLVEMGSLYESNREKYNQTLTEEVSKNGIYLEHK